VFTSKIFSYRIKHMKQGTVECITRSTVKLFYQNAMRKINPIAYSKKRDLLFTNPIQENVLKRKQIGSCSMLMFT